jgi:type 1 glutamine amidotransferase
MDGGGTLRPAGRRRKGTGRTVKGQRAEGKRKRSVGKRTKSLGLLFAAVGVAILTSSLAAQNPAPGQPLPVQGRAGGVPAIPGQNPNGMHIYIRAGLKTHGPGQHDYPQFLADWSKILTEHGAVVDGSFHSPTAAELQKTDVIVIYKGDAGYMTDTEKADLEAFVKRGGGLVSFHDSLCGPDPEYFSTLVGGAKKHGEVNYTLDAEIPYTIADKSSPIMQGMTDFKIEDEAFFLMTWARSPAIHVLATAVMAATPSAGTHAGEVVPQIWTYEHTMPGGQPARAFVWMQGHNYANFVNPQIQPMLLRGIAWAGKGKLGIQN